MWRTSGSQSSNSKGVGPGSKAAIAPAPQALPEPVASIVIKNDVDSNDPNKNQFGSSPVSNGRKLTASIQPIAGPRSSLCRVNIRIVSTDQSRPLEGPVKLFLHPTFGRGATYDVEVKDGVAQDTIDSYGAFTIGAQMDNGQTRLELDLMDVQGGTVQFYKE
jgi:hypothetical protein